jgi:hypothetical protein
LRSERDFLEWVPHPIFGKDKPQLTRNRLDGQGWLDSGRHLGTLLRGDLIGRDRNVRQPWIHPAMERRLGPSVSD